MNAALRLLITLAVFIVSACNPNTKTNTPVVGKTIPPNPPALNTPDTTTITDSIATVTLHNGAALVKGHLNGIGSRSVIEFEVAKADTLQAQIKPLTGIGNVRINQIQLPDKTLDGPFGQSLMYPLRQTGKYALIIGEDMMAEGNWKGNYLLTIRTK